MVPVAPYDVDPEKPHAFRVLLVERMEAAGYGEFQELAEAADMNPGTLSHWLAGRASPRVESLRRLARALTSDPDRQRDLVGAFASSLVV